MYDPPPNDRCYTMPRYPDRNTITQDELRVIKPSLIYTIPNQSIVKRTLLSRLRSHFRVTHTTCDNASHIKEGIVYLTESDFQRWHELRAESNGAPNGT